ncbi:hypothetical protein BLOT_001516 [Blomia tropicalis]|nr:hypothetical protein BLOT_001516 [Blomia tropicalis]
MWLQINSFWEVIATKDVIFGGIIYEELSELVLTFPIMVPRNESALYMYADLQHTLIVTGPVENLTSHRFLSLHNY